jgi:hypothetical protein
MFVVWTLVLQRVENWLRTDWAEKLTWTVTISSLFNRCELHHITNQKMAGVVVG